MEILQWVEAVVDLEIFSWGCKGVAWGFRRGAMDIIHNLKCYSFHWMCFVLFTSGSQIRDVAGFLDGVGHNLW